MFIKLDQQIGPMNTEAPKPVMVNFDYVAKISPGDATTGRKFTKITMHNDQTLAVTQSLDYIEAVLTGTLDKGYMAPEPKDP